jgi:hypothetical protein
VHHVDDFSSKVLMDCQRAAILEPDLVLVVSEAWQRILLADYGVHAEVVPNGVDMGRFAEAAPARVAALRASVGAADRPLLLAVGGVEPRKGSDTLMSALAGMKSTRPVPPVLAVLGGHSFQDHRAYRDKVLGSLDGLSLELGAGCRAARDRPDDDVPVWYSAADALAFRRSRRDSARRAGGHERRDAGGHQRPAGVPRVPGHGRTPVGAGRGRAGLQAALTAVLDDTVLRQLWRRASDGVPVHLGA